MISEYKYREIEKALKNDLDRYETLTKLWGDVLYHTKKDGMPFKSLSKNITGAKVKRKLCATRSYEKELIVGGWTIRSGHVSDYINLYEYVDDDIHILDLEDIKNKINEKIEWCDYRIGIIKYQIDHLREACEQCDEIQKHFRSLMGDTNMCDVARNYMKYIL